MFEIQQLGFVIFHELSLFLLNEMIEINILNPQIPDYQTLKTIGFPFETVSA